MSEKIPEPKDYPHWLAGFLFSPENIIRHGRKTSERNIKTLHQMMQVARVDDRAQLLFDVCIEHEQLRIDTVLSRAALRDAHEEISSLKCQIDRMNDRMIEMGEMVETLATIHAKKIKKIQQTSNRDGTL